MKSNRLTQAIGALTLVAACSAATTATAGLSDYNNARYYDRFNPPPERFNTKSAERGFDSNGRVNPNALQVPNHEGRQTIQRTPLYDNQGRQLSADGRRVETQAGHIGLYNGDHRGKLLAGGMARINIGGRNRDCIFVNAAKRQGGGTFSGWMRLDKISPAVVKNYNNNIKRRRDSSSVRYTANPGGNRRYNRMTVQTTGVPRAMRDGYIIKNRTSNAGKVEYYYYRDGTLNGFVNLPETGNKRHGVQCSRATSGQSFWRDKDVDYYEQTIYKNNSSRVAGTFRFAYGFFETSAGERIYCWTNREVLKD